LIGEGNDALLLSAGGSSQNVNPMKVPEPSTLALFFAGGLAGLRTIRRRN